MGPRRRGGAPVVFVSAQEPVLVSWLGCEAVVWLCELVPDPLVLRAGTDCVNFAP